MSENKIRFENRLGFYIINIDYLEYLHNYDHEVQYNPEYKEKIKPHLGIVVVEDNQRFLIPLTSPKEKYKKIKKNVFEYHKIYNKNNELTGILLIKKMIPISLNLIKKITFENGNKYHLLLSEQLIFISKEKEVVLSKINSFYNKKINNGTVYGSTNILEDIKLMEKFNIN
ncbi:type III toxin-antitoxin system ToxN/AbiQ family toxin [Mycoplasma anserisalpingitidis]|uniref:Type III toxin-antitoxin system ToxN/AbiQ family toxin n=1 Tax=Mycoplasma anserisalpingitidis TaxID=519450 RepID=A0A5B8JB98_9MOLU|nr:type III toxin-antitoxin system ToxN/AbiQ family toxin [Mycoplasma anserisalpingitidis]QDY88372.1 hypothetical protein FOY43_01690 [Mycoplasma anserisalpingitidis]